MEHISVLLKETVDGLALSKNDIVVDGTLGRGGHALEICKRLDGKVKLYAFDLDAAAFEESKEKLEKTGAAIVFINSNFRFLKSELAKREVASVNRILLDLGLSSPQIDASGRGFSFLRDEPLHMTMTRTIAPETVTAEDVVNTWSETSLADIIYGFGEERYSRRIAKAIVLSRKEKKITRTSELVEIIKNAVPASYRNGKIHPATRTFQAIRMAVNEELSSIEEGVKDGLSLLANGGRMAVITFHSLEDRIVKRLFHEAEKNGIHRRIIKKPIIPAREETQKNPRARSAKLRIIEKI